MPGPVSLTLTTKLPFLVAADMHTSPASVKFDSVADQIQQNLGQAWLVAEAVGQALNHVSPDGELLGGGERLGGHSHRFDHADERVFAEVQFELARLYLGDVDHGVDEAKQVLAVGLNALDDADRFIRQLAKHAVPQELRIAKHGSEWGS